MLMTRFLFMTFSALMFLLNAAALWQAFNAPEPASSIVAAALIVNAFAWPLALFATYRIGQATAAELRRKARAKQDHSRA